MCIRDRTCTYTLPSTYCLCIISTSICYSNSQCKKMDAAQIKEETIKLNNTIAEVDQNSVVLHDINFYAKKVTYKLELFRTVNKF